MDATKQIRLSDDRVRTNPVLCFEDWISEYFPLRNPDMGRRLADQKLAEWMDAGVCFPTHAVERFRSRGWLSRSSRSGKRSAPRIVGLVFDRDRSRGLVDPLITKCASTLTHSPLLPFSAQSAQSLLLRVCEKLIPQIPGAVPEALGFAFSESLHENCIGNSMDVAALLSCLDAMTDQRCELFSAACAVVELGSDDALIPVRNLEVKLDAFLREYGHGSLLVVSPESKLDSEASAAFDTIWEVPSLDRLAAEIRQYPSVLSALQTSDALQPDQIGLVMSRLRALEEQRNSADVIRLCERISECGFHDDVVLYERTRIRKYHADALRHEGRYRESLAVGNELRLLLKECETLFSSDELMGHDVDKAAALFDACRFREAHDLLEPWLALCDKDPQRFSSQKRIELFNTIARCMIMLQMEGWQQLLARSITLQGQTDRSNIRRTESYLCHGLLRIDQLEAAEAVIRKHEASLTDDPFIDGFTRFYRYELERRRGALWPANARDLPRWQGYTYAFALQAIGRQRNRPAAQCADLLSEAVQHLRPMCDGDDNVLNVIAHALLLLQAALRQDEELWSTAGDWLQHYVHSLGDAKTEWFGAVTDEMGSQPSLVIAEKLMCLMPYL